MSEGAALPGLLEVATMVHLVLWHVFDKPFVYVMLAIASVHVAVALYFGYAGRW